MDKAFINWDFVLKKYKDCQYLIQVSKFGKHAFTYSSDEHIWNISIKKETINNEDGYNEECSGWLHNDATIT